MKIMNPSNSKLPAERDWFQQVPQLYFSSGGKIIRISWHFQRENIISHFKATLPFKIWAN